MTPTSSKEEKLHGKAAESADNSFPTRSTPVESSPPEATSAGNIGAGLDDDALLADEEQHHAPVFSKWGRMSAEDESSLHRLPAVSDEGLRAHSSSQGKMPLDSSSDDYLPSYQHQHNATDSGELRHTLENPFPSLPSELVHHILSYLSPVDLAHTSITCHFLRVHATADHLWQAIIQSHVPGIRVTSPYPCDTFRDLYIAQDPYWFLPKYKLWFCDRDLTGKLIIMRYDQRRGCIEGYQLLANRTQTTYEHWAVDSEVIIHAFEPEVKLHLDKPVLQLRPHGLQSLMRARQAKSNIILAGASSTCSSCRPYHNPIRNLLNRFAVETPMPLDDRQADGMYSNFMLARAISADLVRERRVLPFPYGNVWPPPAVPARHRVSAASLYQREGRELLANGDRPLKRSEVSDQAFRIRSWMEMRPSGLQGIGFGWSEPLNPTGEDPEAGLNASNVQNQASTPWRANHAHSQPLGLHIGEEVTTYSTLDPKVYAPTPDQPWRGIWVGDYSAHGCEFLLVNQVHEEPFDEAAFEQRDEETEEDYEKRKHEARIYRGRLEAIKLTGDPNVPRGEYTFVADDLGEKGFVTVVQEEPFRGTRVVESRGHIATTGFLDDRYIESQLLLISSNRLAQYWVGFGHISFFERVDIDKFLAPK